MADTFAAEFYILSLKWSRGDMLTWYMPDACGYTDFLDQAGVYSEAQARKHHYPPTTLMVPVAAADALAGRCIGGSRKQKVIDAAAAAGFVIPPPEPEPKRPRRRCIFCPKYVARYEVICRSCKAVREAAQ